LEIKKCSDLLKDQNNDDKEATSTDTIVQKESKVDVDESVEQDDNDVKSLKIDTDISIVSDEVATEDMKEPDSAKQVLEENVADQTDDIAEVEVEEFYVKYKNL